MITKRKKKQQMSSCKVEDEGTISNTSVYLGSKYTNQDSNWALTSSTGTK